METFIIGLNCRSSFLVGPIMCENPSGGKGNSFGLCE